MNAKAEVFWSRVASATPEECWNWTGAKTSSGYGCLGWNGDVVQAHRVAAFLHGIISSVRAKESRDAACDGSEFVLHTCDNRLCCNPKHLVAGSLRDNMLDAYSKNRKVQPRGEKHSNATTSNVIAETIRSESTGAYGEINELARKHGLSRYTVSDIVKRKTYK